MGPFGSTWRSRRGLFVSLVLLVMVAAGCDWPMFRYDSAGTGFNPTESKVGVANVGSLVQKWFGWTYRNYYAGVYSSPAVSKGVAYLSSTDGLLYAFDATPSGGCAAQGGLCSPLWTGGPASALSSPTVADGVVYVTAGATLVAFDAAGTSGCSGTPKTCSPLWTAAAGNIVYSYPVVANGVVYLNADDGKLYAFDAAGTTNCSGTPKTCSPLWTATVQATGSQGSAQMPAVANGLVYVASGANHRLYAFDAAGITGCSGTTKTCTWLWRTEAVGGGGAPAVSNGVVYVNSSPENKLLAFDAAGTTGCLGTPKTCAPLWTTAVGGSGTLAVAKGVVYAGGPELRLYAFDATGTTGCSGTPKICTPLWRTATVERGYLLSSAAIANGVVYLGTSGSPGFSFDVHAYDATGTAGCSGVPKTCTPLWGTSTTSSRGVVSSPAVANGVVYINSDDGTLIAYGLP